MRQLVRRAQIGREYTSSQPVGRVIGAGHDLVQIIKGQRGNYGAENLFAGDAHVVGDAAKNGGLDVMPAFQRSPFGAVPAGQNRCAFRRTIRQKARNPVGLTGRDDGPDIRALVDPLPDLQPCSKLRHAAGEFIMDLARHKQPRSGDANLTRVCKDRHRGHGHRLVDIRVLAHDNG